MSIKTPPESAYADADSWPKGPISVPISANVPENVKQALDQLSELTGQSSSHHQRIALSRYLLSDDVRSMIDEHIAFHGIEPASDPEAGTAG